MDIKTGEKIFFKILPATEIHNSTVITAKGNSLTLKLQNDITPPPSKGTSIIVTYNDFDYYGEVEYFDGAVMKANILWTEKREYFRVNDFFQIVAKKVTGDELCFRSRIFSGGSINVTDELIPDETINPVLWKMLVDINSKLGLILERLNPDSESLLKAESKAVSISGAGICFAMDERVENGDMVEVKMLLPNIVPIGIVTYGKVVRVTQSECGQYNVALSFKDIEDEIRDEIIQYTLKRQRDIMKRQRMKKGLDN